METAPIRRLPKLERNQLIDMLKLRNLLKYKSFDEDQDLLINHRIFQREQLLDSYHWKLEWLIPLPIQDWVLIWCTFPGGEITSLSWRLGDLLVCAAERQGRHASFPGEGSPPTEAKNGDGGGVWRGSTEGLMPSFPVRPSYLIPLGWLTSNWGSKEQESWGETKKVGMWGLDAFFLSETELSPSVERAHLRLTSGGLNSAVDRRWGLLL